MRRAMTFFCCGLQRFLHMRSSKNEFIKPASRVKLPVAENYKLRGMVGLCKYGHILYNTIATSRNVFVGYNTSGAHEGRRPEGEPNYA